MKAYFAIGLLAAYTFALSQMPPRTLELANARDIDLDGLRGLGPSTTRLILQERERRPFKDWQDLMRRTPGIGPKKAEQLSEQGLRVQGQPYPAINPH